MPAIVEPDQWEARALELILGLPHRWQGPKRLGHHLLPPRACVNKELDWQRSRDWHSAPVRSVGISTTVLPNASPGGVFCKNTTTTGHPIWAAHPGFLPVGSAKQSLPPWGSRTSSFRWLPRLCSSTSRHQVRFGPCCLCSHYPQHWQTQPTQGATDALPCVCAKGEQTGTVQAEGHRRPSASPVSSGRPSQHLGAGSGSPPCSITKPRSPRPTGGSDEWGT